MSEKYDGLQEIIDEALESMAAAVIDRVVHHGRLVQFRGESYRVRHALMQEG